MQTVVRLMKANQRYLKTRSKRMKALVDYLESDYIGHQNNKGYIPSKNEKYYGTI